jgi:bifunctional UDP-N-acetylglucosamine pyrophosphorylase / glucosamine-1-phosphate N-acetyltransferase
MLELNAAAIVLAAGKGTRMKSSLPKVMHRIGGRTLIGHVLDCLAPLSLARIVAVIAPGMDSVEKEVAPHGVAFQAEHTPFVATATLRRMFERRKAPDDPAIVVLGMRPADPSGYGRLVMGADGTLDRIVEHKDANEAERTIGLANSGVMAIDGSVVWDLIDRLDNKNAKGEFYLTDLVAHARKDGRRCAVVEAPHEELLGVNSRTELAAAEAMFQARRRLAAMENGATLTDPASVFFAADTKVGRDVVIGPNVQFGPGVEIGDEVEIRAFCHIEGATIGQGATVGPFARIRPRSTIGAGAHVGNFIELKGTEIGVGAKANHVSYLGDATIGAKANIGAGTIVCNYDGLNKTRSLIGAGAFIGSDSVLVSPVTVGEGAYVAAGSVITHDVPSDALAVARAQQVDKPGWAAKFRAKQKSKKKD